MKTAHSRKHDARLRRFGSMGRVAPALARNLWAALIVSLLAATIAFAGDGDADEMRSLDERVQAVKSDVLAIAAELSQLEEKLLYPSNTQVAVFVSLAEGDSSAIDSVEMQIDGEAVVHHIYTYKELEALGNGGVQRLYTGNLTTGAHGVSVVIRGRKSGDQPFEQREDFSIEKAVEPKIVGLRLAASESGGLKIELGDG